MNDYAPGKEEETMLVEKGNGNDDDREEKLTNDLAEIGQVLPDESANMSGPTLPSRLS